MCEVSPPAIQLDSVSKSFVKAHGFTELLVTLESVGWLFDHVPMLRKYRDKKPVLGKLSFSVPSGKIFGILGSNGTGKSTLVNLICGWLEPDSGEIRLHGKLASEMDFHDRAAVLHKCNPKGLLTDVMSARDNVLYAADLHGLPEAAALERGLQLLRALGFDEEDFREPVRKLSLGSKAKVAMVCTVLPVLGGSELPPILVLDEPTLGFDPEAMQSFFDGLRALRRALPELTVLIATNDQREVGMCDDYVTVGPNGVYRDAELLSRLHAANRHCEEARRLHIAMLRPNDVANGSQPTDVSFDASLFEQTVPPNAFRALWRRGLREMQAAPALNIILVISISMPYILSLFAAGSGMGMWHSMVGASLSVYLHLLIRDNLRFLDRERNYHVTLESMLLSRITRLHHYIASTSFGLFQQSLYAAVISSLIGVSLWFQIDDGIWMSLGQLTVVKAAGLALGLVSLAAFAWIVGITLHLVPFILRPVESYFILGLFPALTSMCSPVFLTNDRLPHVFAELVHFNPFSYSVLAVYNFLGLTVMHELPLTAYVGNLLGITNGWSNIVCSLTLSLLYLAPAVFFARKVEKLLLRLGRLRLGSNS